MTPKVATPSKLSSAIYFTVPPKYSFTFNMVVFLRINYCRQKYTLVWILRELD